MGTAPWRAFTAALEMARITASGALLITAFTTSKSGATKRDFIVRYTTFSLLDLHLSFCDFPIANFNCVLLWANYLYSTSAAIQVE